MRIFIKAKRQVYHQSKGIEVYSYKQYVTITGNCKSPKPIEWRDAELAQFLAEYFPQQKQPAKPQPMLDCSPMPLDDMPEVDQKVWRKMFTSNNGDKLFAQYKGTWAHPSGDLSVRDWSFLQSLVYWTNGNAEQIKRMALQSGLKRSKWFENRGDATWLDYEIQAAVQQRKAA